MLLEKLRLARKKNLISNNTWHVNISNNTSINSEADRKEEI